MHHVIGIAAPLVSSPKGIERVVTCLTRKLVVISKQKEKKKEVCICVKLSFQSWIFSGSSRKTRNKVS
jgi:hypothetical protein